MAGDGSVIVRDFGIVRLGALAAEDATLYQSPEEIAAPGSADELSDIFAWGAVYYELLTGNHPFLLGTPGDLHLDLLHHEPAPLRELAPTAPRR